MVTVAQADAINGAIRRIAITHKTLGGQLLTEIGLHVGQEVFLQAIAERGPSTQQQLADYAGCEPPTVTTGLRKLEAQGLVTRARSTRDARAMTVDLTDAGRDLLSPLERVWVALGEITTAGLSDEEIDALAETLTTLADRLTAARAARRPTS